jgi:hypothetical protein
MPIMGVSKFERFFRAAAGLDVDKSDLKRYSDFVSTEIYDMFLIGRAHAKANGRDIIEAHDMPITKGLQESIHDFRKLDEDIELEPLLEYFASQPPLEIAISDAARDALPEIAGGLSVALARTFKILDPDLRNPQTEHWEKAIAIFSLLL